VTNDPHDNYRADRDFFLVLLKSRVIAASMKVLGMDNKASQPANYALPADLMDMPKLQRLECLHKAAAMVVDLFVIDEQWLNGLVTQVCFYMCCELINPLLRVDCLESYLLFQMWASQPHK
jgi:hypothetical protein